MKKFSAHYALIYTLLLVCLACSQNVWAHKAIKEGDTVTARNGASIYIKQINSYEMKYIAQLMLFNLECSTGDAFKIGAGVAGDYFLPKFGSFHAEYFNSYFGLQKMHAGTLNKGENSLSNFSLLEAGGRFHIIDKNGRAKHKLILSNTSNGTITTTEYLRAKLPCRRILALRGGFYRTTAVVSTDMNKDELPVGDNGGVKTKDGTVFSDVYFTNSHTTGCYVGLSDIINMSVYTKNNVSGYQGEGFFTSKFREVFADVLIASTSFDDFRAGSKSYPIEPNAKGSFQTSNIGWRLGKTYIRNRRHLTVAYNFEIGSRPGVQGRGLYFGTGINLVYIR